MSKDKKKKNMKIPSIVVNESQVNPKFKIGELVTHRIHLGEYRITHIYFKNGVISYSLSKYNSIFQIMANELFHDVPFNKEVLAEERYLEYI